MIVAALISLYVLGAALMGMAIMVIGASNGGGEPRWFRITTASVFWPIVTLAIAVLVAIKGTRA